MKLQQLAAESIDKLDRDGLKAAAEDLLSDAQESGEPGLFLDNLRTISAGLSDGSSAVTQLASFLCLLGIERPERAFELKKHAEVLIPWLAAELYSALHFSLVNTAPDNDSLKGRWNFSDCLQLSVVRAKAILAFTKPALDSFRKAETLESWSRFSLSVTGLETFDSTSKFLDRQIELRSGTLREDLSSTHHHVFVAERLVRFYRG